MGKINGEKDKEKKMLKWFLGSAGVFLGMMALIVILVDPFFHYHKPWFDLPVLWEPKEYKIPGIIDYFEYDSLLCGSSVVMSIDTEILDDRFGTKTIKAVGGLAGAPLLYCYLDKAFERQELKYVYYGLDVFSFYYDPENPLAAQEDAQVAADHVEHLANKNPFDDVKYLWNGDVIGRTIPDLLLTSESDSVSWGKTYNYNEHMACSPDEVLKEYFPDGVTTYPQKDIAYQWEYVEKNLERLGELVKKHPDTEFMFFIPPYSILWWDRAYNEGLMDAYVYTLSTCLERLQEYDNVKIYTTGFDDAARITNLYLYGDVIHAGSEVTDQMVYEIGDPSQEITTENVKEHIKNLEEIFGVFQRRMEVDGVDFLYEQGGMRIES